MEQQRLFYIRMILCAIVSFYFVAADKKCSDNETWAVSGYDCQTCQTLRAGIKVSCAENFSEKCYCNIYFVRDTDTGKCIEQSKCYPPITDCPDNEHYSESGYDCLTCQDITAGILKKCALNPETKCYCDSGFNRDTVSGECRPYDKCKNAECSINETFAESGYDCQTCATITENCNNLTLESKCYCNGGYVREFEGGNCVLYEECVKFIDPRCKANETFGIYFNCQTCTNYPYVRCALVKKAQCVCFPGYVHHDTTGQCIQTTDCPNKIIFPSPCPEHETYAQSGSDCETCQDVAAGIAKDCVENTTEQCYCDSDYYRDVDTKQCRSYSDCKS